MSTYLELQTDVQNIVIDLPNAVVSAVPTLVNNAMRTAQVHNFKVMEAEAGFTTLEGERHVTMPTNFKEYRGEPWLIEDTNGTMRRMYIAPNREGLLLAFSEEDVGRPQVLLDDVPTSESGVRYWAIYPLPDGGSDYSDGEYHFVVPYYKYLTALSADGDTNWLTVNAAEYITFKAVAEAFARDWDEQRSAVWEQKAQVKYLEVVKKDKQYRVSGVSTMVPMWRGVNSPKIRW